MRPVLLLFLVLIPFVSHAEYNTIADLTKAYDDKPCRACHEKIYDEWKSSYHAMSVSHTIGGFRNFIRVGLEKEWRQPVSKELLMRCMTCHAPLLEEASEALMKEIGGLIITAAEDNDEAKKGAAKKALAGLSVNCFVCHNTKVLIERNLRKTPVKDVLYGPGGKTTTAHKTGKSPVLKSAAFCGQCHSQYTPADGDPLICNTLYGSYQNAYLSGGGTQTCQDCHMKKNNRGHSFPGTYDIGMLREGLGLDIQVSGIRRPEPTAVVNVSLTNNAGHRTPDG